MGKSYLNDPSKLKAFVKRFEEKKTSKVYADENEALAEAYFRLGVHAETSSSDAFYYLHQAFKRDGTNPKYAYHLGRLNFIHDNMDKAGHWLSLAARLCPTSHRIWTHISLLQYELNIRYKGNTKVEQDVLKKRGDDINNIIRDGKDDFAAHYFDFRPPEINDGKKGKTPSNDSTTSTPDLAPSSASFSTVSRTTDKDRCRWTGIHDIQIEQNFESTATSRKLTTLYPLLDEVIQLSQKRKNGVFAFAILAIEWLVSGYPVATIRRLRQHLPSQLECKTLEVLNAICQFYEADDNELPELLAKSLEDGVNLPLLIALIHKKRLLWSPLTFGQMDAYRSAKKFLEDEKKKNIMDDDAIQQRQGVISDLNKDLKTIIKSLNPKPPTVINDAPPKTSAAKSSDQPFTASLAKSTLAELEQKSKQLKQFSENAFVFMKNTISGPIKQVNDDASFSQIQTNHAAFKDLLANIENAGKQGVEQLNVLLEQILGINDIDALGDDFGQRIESCRNMFNGIIIQGNFKKILSKADKTIIQKSNDFSVIPTPISKELESLLNDVSELFIAEQAALASADGPLTASEAKSILSELEEKSGHLKLISVNGFNFLRLNISQAIKKVSDDKTFSQIQTDHAAFSELLTNLENAGKQGVEQLNELSEQILGISDIAALGNDFGQRIEICRNTFNGIITQGNFKRVHAKASKAITQKSKDFQIITTPVSKELETLINDAQALFTEVLSIKPSDEHMSFEEKRSELPTEPAEDTDQSPLTDLAALEQAIADVDNEIEARFDFVNATFAAYSQKSLYQPPIHALFAMVRSREAETYYRMEYHQKARKLWNAVLIDDRLNAAALKNIAVCDTNNADLSRVLSSWRSYCEMLYLQAVIVGDPRYNVKKRIEFHETFASAFAPEFLNAKLDNDWSKRVDKDIAISFLSSPARFRSYVDHTLLVFFNRKLDFSSPTLILGVGNAERSYTRARAKETLDTLMTEVKILLPQRAGDPFSTLCKNHFETAFNLSKKKKGLIKKSDPHYSDEQKVQLDWVVDILKLLYKFSILLNTDEKISEAINSFESLEQLDRLTRFPIGLSHSLYAAAAQHFSPKTPIIFSVTDKTIEHLNQSDPPKKIVDKRKKLKNKTFSTEESLLRELQGILEEEELESYRAVIMQYVTIERPFLDSFKNVKKHCLLLLIESIFSKQNGTWTSASKRNYKRLIERWLHQPMLEEFLEIIDDPQQFYPQVIMDGIQSGRADLKAIAELTKWNEQFPELSGPAYYLAALLSRGNDAEEAIAVLEKAIATTFSKKGRERCQGLLDHLRLQCDIKKGNFASALSLLKQIGDDKFEAQAVLSQLATIYNNWINDDPGQAIGRIPNIMADFDWWEGQCQKPIDDEVAKYARKIKGQLMAVVVSIGLEASSGDDPSLVKQALTALDKILDYDKENLLAVNSLLSICWRLGVTKLNNDQRKIAKPFILAADDLASKLLDTEFNDNAQQIKNQINRLDIS